MKTRLLFCALFLAFWSSLAPALTGAAEQDTLKPVAEEIRYEATLPEDAEVGRPLPLASHWNTGLLPDTFTPEYQLKLIDEGHYFLPAFQLPGHPKATKEYYEGAIKKAAALKIPFTLVSTQWESLLTNEQKFFSLPPDQNPNVVTPEGEILKKVSPFGPVEHWQEAGKMRVSDPLLAQIAQWYPDPPLVLFLSNNEHPKLRWHEAETSKRYLTLYGQGKDGNFKRKVVGDGWIERYRALIQGMRDNLPSSWKAAKTFFVGYNAWGGDGFGIWGGWINYSLYIPGRFEPWPMAFEGASPSYYLHTFDNTTDFTVKSPQIKDMNFVFMLDEARSMNPAFWFEFSIWDGYEPGKEYDKRSYYKSVGQEFTPERYGGFIQFGMWLLRPRVVREFRGWTQKVAEDTEPYFLSLLAAVDRVHKHPVLRRFWRKGTLVPNTAHQHPFQANIPSEYKAKDRWFLLDTNVDPQWPWSLDTEIPVFALAHVLGEKPNREWLIYAFSPVKERKDIQVTIPDYKAITVSATPKGDFHWVRETDGAVEKLDVDHFPPAPPQKLKLQGAS